jgi:hypothetical protein
MGQLAKSHAPRQGVCPVDIVVQAATADDENQPEHEQDHFLLTCFS